VPQPTLPDIYVAANLEVKNLALRPRGEETHPTKRKNRFPCEETVF
jgi:hypothetical protein